MTLDSNNRPEEQPGIVLARWSTRFWAWLVDFIIVNVALGILFVLLAMPILLAGLADPNMMATMMSNTKNNGHGQWWGKIGGPFTFAINSLAFFGYWTFMESRYNGQSIGKMLLHIKVANLEGKAADTKSIAISSFGKAFILPLDVLLGWIFTNEKRQRLLGRAADTLVIKTVEPSVLSSGVSYRKE